MKLTPEQVVGRLNSAVNVYGSDTSLGQHHAEMSATVSELISENKRLREDSDRLKWLHTGGSSGARKEWGVAEIEFDANGQFIGASWGLSDSSDIDKAMADETILRATGKWRDDK